MVDRRALAVAYLYPALVLGLAIASGIFAYLYFAEYILCGPNRQVACLEEPTYFGFEAVVYVLLAYLATRAVGRVRKGKDAWTMRVYWPIVLGAFALVTLATYIYAIVPARGCDVGWWYVGHGCWDPGVTSLRVTAVLVLTSLFTFGLGTWAHKAGASPDEPDSGSAEGEALSEEPVEEITAH